MSARAQVPGPGPVALRRRSRPSLAAILLTAFVALIGSVAVVPAAPAQAVTDHPLDGEWGSWPWNSVNFVGSNAYLPNYCGKTHAFRSIRKVGVNRYVGEVAKAVQSTCPPTTVSWEAVDLTIAASGTEMLAKTAGSASTYIRKGGLQKCPSVGSVTKQFNNSLLETGSIFSVQFNNLNYCYDYRNVWFRDAPHYRIYIASSRSWVLQGTCNGASKTDTGLKLPSIIVTCNATFSNKGSTPYTPMAVGDTTGASRFNINSFLNFGFAFANGFIATAAPADVSRYFTLRLYADGCYNVSGIGDNTLTCR